jgi:hypothetical protein
MFRFRFVIFAFVLHVSLLFRVFRFRFARSAFVSYVSLSFRTFRFRFVFVSLCFAFVQAAKEAAVDEIQSNTALRAELQTLKGGAPKP